LFILFFLIATFIPSMSGFARAVMPTVGGTLSGAANGITYSGSILTFSFASGLVNLIMPTAYIMLIGLERVDSKIGSFYRRS
jgi:uncharacterized ion transporter superfamily protein YfcC